jgi:hypothetical protein
MLILLRLELSAPVRLGEPSRDNSVAVKICTLPGILSMSIGAPGVGVDPMTTTSASGVAKPESAAPAPMAQAAVPMANTIRVAAGDRATHVLVKISHLPCHAGCCPPFLPDKGFIPDIPREFIPKR